MLLWVSILAWIAYSLIGSAGIYCVLAAVGINWACNIYDYLARQSYEEQIEPVDETNIVSRKRTISSLPMRRKRVSLR
jgi:hypothetical protein